MMVLHKDAMLFILFSLCISKRKLKGFLFFLQDIQGLEIYDVQECCHNKMHSGLSFSFIEIGPPSEPQ